MSTVPEQAGKEAFTVRVEAIAWVHTFVGGPASGAREFLEPAAPGDTVRDVLTRLSDRFPKLKEALWEGREIGPHIELIVNDTILGVSYTLDSPVNAGDEILLAGQYVGG